MIVSQSRSGSEGNWGAWLMSKDKLNSFTWIGNKNSGNKLRNQYNQELIGNYQNLEREDYVFEDYDFDHIFICLSPQYTPKNHYAVSGVECEFRIFQCVL